MALSGNINVHRPSSLKQKNKKHNTLGHRTKGQVQALSKGMKDDFLNYIINR